MTNLRKLDGKDQCNCMAVTETFYGHAAII